MENSEYGNDNRAESIAGGRAASPASVAALSYLKAQSIAQESGLVLKDIVELSENFWRVWTSPALCMDGAASTLFAIQYNLVIGTLGMFTSEREDLLPLVEELLQFKTFGQFCLTELGHGLDVFHLETTATLLDNGSFLLHTPNAAAAKFMPPTVPVLGRPCVAIVFARLIVNGQNQGIRPFLVRLNDGHQMAQGISSRRLPYRGASKPVNHSLTSFSNVELPPQSLLGEVHSPLPEHLLFLLSIWRVAVGTLSLSLLAIPVLQISSHIAYHYSVRRRIRDHHGRVFSILSFRTQEIPVYTAVAQSYVFSALAKHACQLFSDEGLDMRIRHGIATCLKVVFVQSCQESLISLSDRCGAQGLFDFNQIASFHNEMRGIAIAEGDILVLSIRLASEILAGKYDLPPADDLNSLLARYEAGLIQEYKELATRHGGCRSPYFATHILPQCQAIVEAIGHRLAFDAAVSSGVPQELINLYVCFVVKHRLAWYIENNVLTSAAFRDMEDEAIGAAQVSMQRWVNEMQVDKFVISPLVSDAAWTSFHQGLKLYTAARGDAKL